MLVTAQVAQQAPSHFVTGTTTDVKSSFATASTIERTIFTKSDPRTIDELIRSRAQTFPEDTILGYPGENGEYIEYNYRQLNIFAFRAAQKYAKIIPQRESSTEKERVVGILGASNLEYLITVLALSKLGFTVLFLSTRISFVAYQSLLESTCSKHLLVDKSFLSMGENLKASIPGLIVGNIDTSFVEERISNERNTRLDFALDLNSESKKIAWIIHSSGSTGLPKPIYQTHNAALNNYKTNLNLKGFITLPLFHAHGISSVFRAFTCQKSIYMYNARLPLTQSNLLAVLQNHNIEIFYGVPYALKLLGESEEGIACLAKLKVVMFGGSACPDSLGDRLVEAGVNLVSHYGTTETGQLMTSFRDRSDKAWNYVRPSADLKPYLKWDLQGGDIYELVVLDGWRSKVTSNRPDGSYATKDLFMRHPSIPDAWKYFARLDDTIILLNGEKAVPTDTEQAVRDIKVVQEAIIVGNGKPQLGLVIIPSQSLSETEVLQQIWPVIEMANKVSPAYAQLNQEMIHILPTGTEYPRTDKGTIIRQAFYKKFEVEIEQLYNKSDEITIANMIPSTEDAIREYLRASISDLLGPAIDFDDDSDFFALGMDSLQALRLRKVILKQLPIKGSALGMNIAFDFPTINALTRELLLLQEGQVSISIPIEDQMQAIIEKYGTFPPHLPRENSNEGRFMIVTGATGSLGAHTIAELARRPDVKFVHCLVRARSKVVARHRVIDSLRERQIYHQLPLSARQKIVALPSDFSKADLGLGWETYDNIARNVTSVIHCAWSVNFNLKLSSFEKDCIAGARNLMLLCLAAKRPSPASFSFCSSVSAVAATPGGYVSESLPAELNHAQNMGYAQSKLVTEHLVQRAADQTGMSARTLRVGQIIADTQHGIWNATEAIPLMLQASVTFGSIPALDESVLWLPVDVVAKSVTEIALSEAGAGVMNVVASKPLHWTRDLLPKLHAAGLDFDEPGQREWIKNLKASDPNPVLNPPIKLVDFFASKYDNDNTVRKGLQYDTSLAQSFSPSLASAKVVDQGLVNKFVAQFRASSWAVPKEETMNLKRPRFIVVAGPCGSGKTTVATSLAKCLHCPYIEGDAYHDEAALSKMSSNIPLTDEDRWSWLERLHHVASVSALNAPSGVVVLTCSALKKEYRDVLRSSDANEAEAIFLLLQVGDKRDLAERLGQRSDHYMKQEMVDGQFSALEQPRADEVDVIPVDASQTPEQVMEEVMGLMRHTFPSS